jgi:hypothetical protein
VRGGLANTPASSHSIRADPLEPKMPEYLHPGVYIEEVSYRTKVIDGVVTLVVGMLVGVATSIAIDRLRRARVEKREGA